MPKPPKSFGFFFKDARSFLNERPDDLSQWKVNVHACEQRSENFEGVIQPLDIWIDGRVFATVCECVDCFTYFYGSDETVSDMFERKSFKLIEDASFA